MHTQQPLRLHRDGALVGHRSSTGNFNREARQESRQGRMADAQTCAQLAHRHGRRARPRRTGGTRRSGVPRPARRTGTPLPGVDQQLDLHPARSVGATGQVRPAGARDGDLDLGTGHRAVSVRPDARRHGVRDRRVRYDHRAARGWLHIDRCRTGLRGAGRDEDVLVRGDHPGDPADRRRQPRSLPPTPTPPARRRAARCRRPVQWPRWSPRRPAPRPISSASQTR